MPLVYIERFVLALIAGLVLFLATANPFSLDPQQRVSGIFALVAAALLVSIYYQKRVAKRMTTALRKMRIASLAALLVSISWLIVDTAAGWSHKTGYASTSATPAATPMTIEQKTYGSNSPAIANNNGQVNVNTGAGSGKNNATPGKVHVQK